MDEIEKMIAEVERLDRDRQRLSAAAMVSSTVAKRYADLTVRAADAANLLAAEVRRLRAELARRDTLNAAWNAGAAEARGRVLQDLAADPRDHMPPEFRADEEIAAAWLGGWAADAAIVRLAEIGRECDDARGVEDEAMVERAAEQEATSTDSGDEYDYTRCICLDSVSRWCPTCGEEYAERRAADKALKVGSPS